MKLYCYKNWSSCKKAVKWLEANKIKYDYYEIYDNPPSKDLLKKLYQSNTYKLKKYFNTSGVRYRELNLKDRFDDLTEEEAFDMLSKDGKLVKRPMLIDDNKVYIGFKEKEWEAIL